MSCDAKNIGATGRWRADCRLVVGVGVLVVVLLLLGSPLCDMVAAQELDGVVRDEAHI